MLKGVFQLLAQGLFFSAEDKASRSERPAITTAEYNAIIEGVDMPTQPMRKIVLQPVKKISTAEWHRYVEGE
ncbi:MAG: hypothetical protein SF029_01365 [bacterium]|nr:hypothetical protein [bacterium]